MLVLTRKPQEKIRIGDDIVITVIKTKGQGVRLGIEAPSDVSILRGELVAAHDSFIEDTKEPQPQANEQEAKGEGNVQFARVKRSRVGTVLPSLLGEPGPLRAMMGGRESSTV